MKKFFLFFLFLFFFNRIVFDEKIGIALGGGAARGLAHIGVLKIIEEYNIPIDYVAGTSMGAIIGGLWASGYTAAQIESIFLSYNIQNWLNETTIKNYTPLYLSLNSFPTFLTTEIKDGKLKIPESTLDDKIINLELFSFFSEIDYAIKSDFRKMYKPFLCIISNLKGDAPKILTSGKLEKSIRTTMALPLLFKPILFDSIPYFDGGIYENIPAKALKDSFNPDLIISVDVSSNQNRIEEKNTSLIDITFAIVDILTKNFSEKILKEYGIYIRPDVGDYRGYEFMKAREIIDKGYIKAKEILPGLKEVIKREEFYPQKDRKFYIEGYKTFDGRIIDTVIVLSENTWAKKTVLNILEMNKNDIFYFDKLKKGIYTLYSLSLFESIEPEITINEKNKRMILIVKVKEIESSIFKLGGFADSKAGLNIYGVLQKNNIFNTLSYMDIYAFAGNYIKGFSLNFFFPSLFYTNKLAGFYNNYHIYKTFNVFDNYFNYEHNYHSTLLIGNNIDNRKLFSFFLSSKYKKYSLNDLFKISAGIYYVEKEEKPFYLNIDGSKKSFIIGLNLPNFDLSLYKINTYNNIFTKNSLNNIYFKSSAYFIEQKRLSKNFNISFSFNYSFLEFLKSDMIVPSKIKLDYPLSQPTFELRYFYDKNLQKKFIILSGISLRYFLNDNLFVKLENEGSILTDQISKNLYLKYFAGTRLSINLSTPFGSLEISCAYFFNNINRNIFMYSLHIGNPLNYQDLLSQY